MEGFGGPDSRPHDGKQEVQLTAAVLSAGLFLPDGSIGERGIAGQVLTTSHSCVYTQC